MKKIIALISLIYLFGALNQTYAGSDPIWKDTFEKEVNWMMISGAGVLLVCTDDALYGINPDTGEEMWKREDQKKIDKEYVEVIDVTPVVMITRKGLRNETIAINTLSGKQIFSTKDFEFTAPHGAMPIYDNATFLVAGVSDESRMTVYNVDMKTGEVNWKQHEWMGEKMGDPQLVKLNQEKTFSKVSILGNQYPVFDSETTFFAHLKNKHLAKYDINTGEMIWKTKFKGYKIKPKVESASAIANGFSQMMYNKNTNALYIPLSNSLVAINAADGSFLWGEKPENLKGNISWMDFTDKGILVKVDETLLTLLDYKTGEPLWKKEFKKFQDRGVILYENGQLLLLTGNDLYEINPDNGEYDHLAKNIKFKKEDPQMMNIVDGKLVLTSDQNIMAINPETGEPIYHKYMAAPGLGALEIIGGALATLAANMASYSMARDRAMRYGSNYNSISNTFEYDVYSPNLAKRFSKSLGTNKFYYVNTKECEVDGKKDKGVVCIDKATGDIIGQVILGDRKPEYEVDQVSNLLFYKSGKKEVSCYKY